MSPTSKLVRYISPFGSPAWMTREKAQKLQAEDDERYVLFSKADCLSERQKQIGPPYYYDPLAK